MTLPLTPEVLRAAYDFLNVTPPFCKWNLPDGEDVIFEIFKSDKDCGEYTTSGSGRNKLHYIRVSSGTVGYTATLMETVAHEMNHLHEELLGLARVGVKHSRFFKKNAEIICRVHGWDPKQF